MQDYREVLPSNTVQEMRVMVNGNFDTLRSTNAGEAFPAENLVLGMKCFRVDEKKTYTLVSLDPLEWEVEASGTGGDEIVNAQKYLAFVGKEALGRLTDWSGLFNRALSVEIVDFADLGIGAHVMNMSNMFHDCMSLKTVLNFKVPQTYPVKDVQGMFSKCTAMSVLDVTGFQAANVENFVDMFSDCHELKTLDVSKWQTGRATNMRGMFRNCWKLETLDLSKWDVSKCTDFAEMFVGCRRLRGMDFTSWDTSKATAMGGMFQSCGNDVTATHGAALDLTAFDLSNVETTAKMFAYAAAKLTIGEKMRKTGKCTNMKEMFAHFTDYVDVAVAGAGYAPPVLGTDYIGLQCKQTIFTAFDYSSVEDISGMFDGTRAMNCTLGQQFTGLEAWQQKNGLIFHVSTPKVQNISRLFASTMGTDFIDLSMDTGGVTNMENLFDGTTAESIRLRNFDTRKMTVGWGGNIPIDGMFKSCRNLRYLIIDGTEFRFKLLTDILSDLPAECRFIVPRAMIPTYKAQEHWKNYGDRFIAMEDCTLYGAYVKNAPT